MTNEAEAQTAAGSPSDEKRYPDHHGLYQRLFDVLGGVRDGEHEEGTVSSAELEELWRRWFEAMAGTRGETTKEKNGFVDSITPLWAEMAEDLSQKMLSEETLSEDPLRFFLRWYKDTNERWSKAADELLKKDEVLESTSQFFESRTRSYGEFRRATEKSLNNLRIPTRSDITWLARLVVVVENKVDRIEEAFEEFIYGDSEPASARAIGGLEERMDRLEDKMDRMLTALEKIEAGGKRDLPETSRSYTTEKAANEAASTGYA